ncbi:MAG: prepilin-type N-terminal cleavage/methylation domain-containing protein [Gammaproteobacteria bacterium]|nr:prepilin-type N-terminal cleavage/methylation domain-containing protein [Gammaproteobacteria bacterium]MBT8109314.1 prepilin-type N-terminal cleavage/methylation domain-containing protein [Gammaproteobacteria bacterium]NND46292.1 prepilin-type N-terminal cleavage/methylation domain-containing protein [Woeseiaceae bacterium]NNL44016.1 prepilin-type N-terminal cleavage/methylation domain-containing protein [Woeseiaceae bacterium]
MVPATDRSSAQYGATLVELLVSIVIVAIAASSVLGVMSMNNASSADPMLRHQASSIAEAYLEEILLKSFDDPDGVDGEAARVDFDDVDDYNGLFDVGARDQFGNPIAPLSGYSVSISVSPSAALPGVPAADVLRVDINVAWESRINFIVSSYRTRL